MTGENYPVPVSGTQTLSMRKEAVGKVKINLDVVNAAGHTAQCSTEINISTCFGPGVMPGDNDAHANVSCTICATPSSVKKGDPVTLKWSSLNALAAMLAIPATGENAKLAPSGSKTMNLNVEGAVGFDLYVGNENGEARSCTASVTVSASLIEPPTGSTCTPRLLWYVNPGSGVHRAGPGVTWMDVYVIGGGGGGGGTGNDGVTWTLGGRGGDSSFDNCTAGGGSGGKEIGHQGGGGGTNGRCDINFPGGNGSAMWGNSVGGGQGGVNMFGGSAGAGYLEQGIPGGNTTGAGGAGGGATGYNAGAAGGGSGAVGEIFVVPASGVHTYKVGAGGFGGFAVGGGYKGGNGGSGAIIIREYCDPVAPRTVAVRDSSTSTRGLIHNMVANVWSVFSSLFGW